MDCLRLDVNCSPTDKQAYQKRAINALGRFLCSQLARKNNPLQPSTSALQNHKATCLTFLLMLIFTGPTFPDQAIRESIPSASAVIARSTPPSLDAIELEIVKALDLKNVPNIDQALRQKQVAENKLQDALRALNEALQHSLEEYQVHDATLPNFPATYKAKSSD